MRGGGFRRLGGHQGLRRREKHARSEKADACHRPKHETPDCCPYLIETQSLNNWRRDRRGVWRCVHDRANQPRIFLNCLKWNKLLFCGGNSGKNLETLKMQERSHQVVENTGSGLGSFAKTNPERTHYFVPLAGLVDQSAARIGGVSSRGVRPLL